MIDGAETGPTEAEDEFTLEEWAILEEFEAQAWRHEQQLAALMARIESLDANAQPQGDDPQTAASPE